MLNPHCLLCLVPFWLLWGWKRGSWQILAFAKNWTYRALMEADFVRSLLALIILNIMERSEDLYVTNTWASFTYKVQEKERQTWDCIAGSTKVAEYCEHLVGHTRNQPNQAPDSDREMIETLLQNFKHLQKFSPELIIKGILRHSQYLEAVPIVISPAPKMTATLCGNLYKHCTMYIKCIIHTDLHKS